MGIWDMASATGDVGSMLAGSSASIEPSRARTLVGTAPPRDVTLLKRLFVCDGNALALQWGKHFSQVSGLALASCPVIVLLVKS